MTVVLLLLHTLITSKQAAILNTIEGSIGPSHDTQAPHDTPKTSPPQPKGGEGKIESYKRGGWRKRFSLSLAQHHQGVERQFSELSEPLRPPYLQFPPYPRGGRARCAATLGDVRSLASLCPEDNVSNKQISFWPSSKGTFGG